MSEKSTSEEGRERSEEVEEMITKMLVLEERESIGWEDVDCVVLPHEGLDEFVGSVEDEVVERLDVYTEDDKTKGKVEFNYIAFDGDVGNLEYGVATQISNPFDEEDSVLDLRDETGGFADWVMGIEG